MVPGERGIVTVVLSGNVVAEELWFAISDNSSSHICTSVRLDITFVR